MDYEKVKELMDKGFSADEIRGMFSTGNNTQIPQENKQESSQEEQKTEQKDAQAAEKTQENTNNNQEVSDNNSELSKQVKELTETVNKLMKMTQDNNLKHSSFDKPTETDMDKEVDNIMAGIVRPARTTKEG